MSGSCRKTPICDMTTTARDKVRIPEHPAGHSDDIRPPKPGYPATLAALF